MSVVRATNVEAQKIHEEINELRTKIALSESGDEKQILLEQIAEKKEELRKINRKEPVVVPVKDGKTVGDKIERKLKTKGRNSASSYNRTTVRI